MCQQIGILNREIETKKEWDENFRPGNIISEIKNSLSLTKMTVRELVA